MRRLATLALCSAGLLLGSCSDPDQRVVQTYFTAVQSGDETMASGVSLVEFPGQVESWEILEIGPEFEEPFELAPLRERLGERRSELEAKQQENQSFGESNIELYQEYTERRGEDPDAELSGEVGEFGEEWESRMEEQKELEAAVAELEADIERLREAARLSLNSMIGDGYTGAVKGKELRLKVRDGSGEKTYKVVVKRYELADEEKGIAPIARWIITDIEEA